MSDTSPTPIPTAVSDSSPTATVPDEPQQAGSPAADVPDMPVAEPQAAPVPASVEPPPPESGATQAGAEAPPEFSAPGAVAPDPTPASDPLIESVPATGSEVKSAVVDTPAAALAILGPEAGVPEGTTDTIIPVSQPTLPMVDHPSLGLIEHPAETVQRMRTKLAAYGEECLKAVQAELEHLQRIFAE